MVNKSKLGKSERGSLSSELTVAELVRLTQGEVVEDEFSRILPVSPKSKTKSPSSQHTDSEPSSPARKHNASQARLPNQETCLLPPIRASASAPNLEKVDETTPFSSDLARSPHNRQRSLPSKFRVRAKEKDQLPHIGLMQDDLRDVPLAEALKQILIENTGSLKQAYKMMDINRDGIVNCFEFEKGLHRAGVYGSPLEGYRNEAHLFQSLDKNHHGSVKLQDLLGYVPVVRHPVPDTRSDWISYNNKASAQKSHLARKPRWNRPLGVCSEHPEVDHLQEHRALKRQLVDERQRGRGLLRMEEKRKLVRGLVADEDRFREWQHQHKRMTEQQERIGVAIHDCGKARSELVALQRAMTQLTPETHRRPTFKILRSQLSLHHNLHEVEDLS